MKEDNIGSDEMILSEGKAVEVTSNEDGFNGAWFAATILELPKSKTEGKALVQYKNLVKDDYKTPLTERVKLSFIRPLPPQPEVPVDDDNDQCFEVNDVVDAFHLDCWWCGYVSQVLDNPKRYLVSFPYPPEEIEFSSSALRPHWDWVDGKWLKSSKFKDSSDCEELVELSCRTPDDAGASSQCESSDAVKGSSEKNGLCCLNSSKNEKCVSACKEPTKRKKRGRPAAPKGDATPLHPSKKIKDGSLESLLPTESDMKDADHIKVIDLLKENVGLRKKYGRRLNYCVNGPKHSSADKTDNLKVDVSIGVSEGQQMKELIESSITRGDSIKCTSGSVTEEFSHATKETTNLQKEHGTSSCQKEDSSNTEINRREPPRLVLEDKQPKLLLRITQSPSPGKDDAADVSEKIVSEECTATEVESSVISGLELAGSQTISTERTALVCVTDSGGIPHENEEQSPLMSYKELQPALGKIHSIVMEENISGDFPPGFENGWNAPTEKSLEIMVHSPSVGMAGNNEPAEGQDLPFVKSLPMWQAVESMEIFQVMPQYPHFQPLVKLKEILREGLAVGHMLSFVSLVHRASKLTVADPRNHFTSILDALPDFEIHGFDVKAVRNRTSDLLSMKDRHGHLQDHSKEFELQVMEHFDNLTKLNEEIDANSKMLRELEEKQTVLSSWKNSEMCQISSLQVCVNDAAKDIKKLEHDFESLAATPW